MGQAESSTTHAHIAPSSELHQHSNHHHISRKEMRKELRRIKRAHKQEKRYSRMQNVASIERERSSSMRNTNNNRLSTHTSSPQTANNNAPISRTNSSPNVNRSSTSTTTSSGTVSKRVVMTEESLSLELEEMGFSRAVICDVLREMTSNPNSIKKTVEPNLLIERLMDETRRRFGEEAVNELQNNNADDMSEEESDGEDNARNSTLDFAPTTPNLFVSPPNSSPIETEKEAPENKDLIDASFFQTDNNNKGEITEVDYCKICMDREIDSVILRCGHLATCMVCSKKLKKCPI
eukprot:TRINITY_DN1599_c0_g4_i1.p1 TRINITY_DN1599_c0_g4~~TRINITY_DN1599_c0_g4_i1.p1  ORF type:complete len:293 (+),score=76.17 TRINITY_DN1599_c0_g4_i1:288-1166(+)